MKILIIEDNDILRKNIKKYLEIQWVEVDDHSKYEESVYKIMTGNYDMVILDLGLWSWGGDGITICKTVREKWNSIPILMLTARTLTPQKIEWLNSGADDYMTKPFDYGELYARIKTIVRRDHAIKWEEFILGDIVINITERSVEKKGIEISLSKLEFNLLVFLTQNKGRVLTKEEITEKVWWEIDMFKESRALDIYVGYLRKKLWSDIIETVRWTWYMIK